MTVVRPPITGDAQQDSWMDQVTNLINSGFFARDTFIVSQGQSGQQGIAGINGQDGFSAATLYLFQRQSNNLPDTAPDDLATDLVYDYTNNILYDQNDRTATSWNGWTQFIPEDDDNSHQYIWVITVNVADRQETEVIPFTSWSTRTLLVSPAVTYEMQPFGFEFIRSNQTNVEIGVRVFRVVGEVSSEITELLRDTVVSGFPNGSAWVRWTKHSQGADLNPGIAADDTAWNGTTGMSGGVTLTIDANDVFQQTEFRAELTDEDMDLPYPTI